MKQTNFVYFNATASSDGADDGSMYNSNALLAMNTTAAGTATLYFKAWNGHNDGPDDIVLTVVSSGDDNADRINRIKAMDAMVEKVNNVNKQGFTTAFSEIENVKPGGIASIAITLDAA